MTNISGCQYTPIMQVFHAYNKHDHLRLILNSVKILCKVGGRGEVAK